MNTKILIILILCIVGLIGIANAQQALPKGGDGFETAIEIKAGNYQGGSIESKEAEYFYVVLKAGEEIQVKGTFTAADIEKGAEAILGLYSEDKTPLIERVDGFYEELGLITASWLAGTAKDSYKCYIKAGSGIFKIASYLLDISVKAPTKEEEKEIAPGTEEGGAEKKGLNWGLIIGIIAGIAILAVIIYLLLKTKKK